MFKKVGTFVAGFVVGTVVLYSWGQIFNKDTDMKMVATVADKVTEIGDGLEGEMAVQADGVQIVAQDTKVSTAQQVSEAITIGGQPAGSSVVVKSIDLKAGANGGWVVIHEVKSGVIANALGAVRRDSGVSTDVEVRLLRGTVAGGTYAVVLYSDNGDRQFSMSTDFPLKDAQGQYIMSTFSAE